MICHAAKQKHRVLEITEGIRYVLILFVYIDNTIYSDKMDENCCLQ